MSSGPGGTSADPVVIGGVGGSGTRAVAGVLRACGLLLPEPLNPQLDTQWGDVLFKRPSWRPVLLAADRRRPVPELTEAVRVLQALLLGEPLDHRRLAMVAAAAAEYADLGRDGAAAGGVRWPPPATAFSLIAAHLARSDPPDVLDRWGWKHPVSQLLLPELRAACDGIRYIHVARHPLDAAWSSNTQGVALWGALAGIDQAQIDAAPADARLSWWLHTMRAALAVGREMGGRFMVVRLEQLCRHPIGVVRRLAAFAGLQPDDATLRSAAGLVAAPASIGRWRAHPLDGFDADRLAAARAWAAQWEPAGDETDPPTPDGARR
jgi:hypothetical protein